MKRYDIDSVRTTDHRNGDWVLYSEAQSRIDALEQELENIAYMGMDDFEDYHEFKVWAQNRAKHVLSLRAEDGV